MEKRTFETFYETYLGIPNGRMQDGVLMCRSIYREYPINKHYYYSAIGTIYKGREIISVAPDATEEEAIEKVRKYMLLLSGNCKISGLSKAEDDVCVMYRMMRSAKNYSEKMPEITADLIYFPEYKKYAAKVGEVIVGYCKISDIINGFGNIVVWVEEVYRRKELAKTLLELLLKKCEEEGIIPIYYVNAENEPSIRLATKAGFEVVQTEVVVREEK